MASTPTGTRLRLTHKGRPHPVGKLILHYTTTPVIEVAACKRAEYEAKLASCGEGGKPVFLPPVPEPPRPHAEFKESFR